MLDHKTGFALTREDCWENCNINQVFDFDRRKTFFTSQTEQWKILWCMHFVFINLFNEMNSFLETSFLIVYHG